VEIIHTLPFRVIEPSYTHESEPQVFRCEPWDLDLDVVDEEQEIRQFLNSYLASAVGRGYKL
jgi:hypothetical protein